MPPRLKKWSLYLALAVMAVAVDGALSVDILDFKIDTPENIILLVLVVFVVVMIRWAEFPKDVDRQTPQ
jgi:hypothetical protein